MEEICSTSVRFGQGGVIGPHKRRRNRNQFKKTAFKNQTHFMTLDCTAMITGGKQERYRY